MSTFGFLTIGQAPRNDVLASMLPEVDNQRVIQQGALDDLAHEQILQLRPREGEQPLVTRMRDGTEVLLAKNRLLPYLQRAVTRTVTEGAGVLVILCTGEFSGLDLPRPAIFPDRVLREVVDAVLPSGTLGMLMPHDGQMTGMREKWQAPGRRFIGAAASPYTAPDDLARLGHRLAAGGADLIVMDCIGYTQAMRASVAAEAGVPIILANRLVGRVIEELMESSSGIRASTANAD